MQTDLPKVSERYVISELGFFRTFTFLFECSNGNKLSPKVEDIISWIKRFNEWFTMTVFHQQSSALHLFYNREIALLGSNLLQHCSEINEIARTAGELGFGISITIDAKYTVENNKAFQELLSVGSICSVSAVITSDAIESYGPAILDLLERTAAKGISLGIIGDLDALFAIGAVDSPLLSSVNITWYPISPTASLAAIPSSPVHSCYGRLRLHVNAEGDIYPCLGLLGLEPFCMGNISDPLTDTLLADEKTMGRIDDWIRRGPDIDNVSINTIRFGLPAVCEKHLAAIGI